MSDPNADNFLDVSIASGRDDAEQRSNGSMYLDSSDLELVTDEGVQQVGLRFNGLSLPAGSIISRAYIQFQTDENNNGATTLTIRGETSNNPSAFTLATNNISSRPLSNASIIWNPAAWNVTGASTTIQQTSNLSSIVQELVDQNGWNSGQSMVFVITGSGRRTAESFEGDSSGAATLHIEYSTDGNAPPIANFTTTPANGDAPLDVNFDASTSTDDGGIISYSWTFGDDSNSTGVTTSHNYATAGTYTATLTITDDEGKSTNTDRIITVNDPNADNFLDVSIASGRDDAEQRSNGSMYLDSSDLELVTDEGVQQVGLRFNGLSLPAGSIISRAYIQFQTDENNNGATTLTIRGETSNNPSAFTLATNNISSRPLSNASIIWNPAAWNVTGASTTIQQTSNLSSIVQELVDQNGWNSGQSMVFVITGSGRRTAESFEGDSSGAATLHIEYSTDGNAPPIANFTTTPANGDAPLDVNFDASTSTDDGGIISYSWTFGDDSNSTGVTTSHNYATAGTYTATLTITDDEGKSTNTDRIITVNDPNAPTLLEVSITSGSDDAEQRSNNSMYLTSSDLELVLDGGIQQVGLRFNSIGLPKGATVTSAHIQFQVNESTSDTTHLNIQGEASDNPSTFTLRSNDISNRPLSNTIVNWSPTAWNVVNQRGSDQQTTDLKNIIQELISRDGWSSGQSMAFIITGNGQRTADSFEGNASGAPTLQIRYTFDGNPPPVAQFTATPTNGDTRLDVEFDATGSSDDDNIVEYAWDFGDGSTASTTTANTTHTYTAPGTYTVSLTVTDSGGKTATNVQTDAIITTLPTFVIINEILAKNDTGLSDGNGLRHDWIELQNQGATSVDMSGWCLTDDEENPQQWCFPTGTHLAAGDYLLVYASKLSGTDISEGELHAPFSLKTGGEYLALFKPNGALADSLDPKYPQQTADVSYGRNSNDALRYFPTPTPNAGNGTGLSDLLIFDTTLLNVTGSTTTQVNLSTLNGNNVAYTLSNDTDWLSANIANGEDGSTADLIDVTTDATGLADGVYIGTITANANDHFEATIAVTMTVGATPETGVVINEVLASNTTGLTDGKGQRHDWIELYNGNNTPVDISGWCITDKESEPQQWCFPAGTLLASRAHLLVYASKLDDSEISAGEFHAQLKLKKGGEYLALLKPDGTFVDGFDPSFPQQTDDISYGHDATGALRYFNTPTPNATNGEGQLNLLIFDENTLEMIGSTTEQVSLSSGSENNSAYSLSSDANWLSAMTANGEDGTTTDLIDVVTNIGGLTVGEHTGIITAVADHHLLAQLSVTVTVQPDVTSNRPWKELDIKLNDIGMGVDNVGSRLFYPLGAGFTPAASLVIELDYVSISGFKIGINGSNPLDKGASYDFGEITYGSDTTIEIYKNGTITSSYSLVLTSTPIIEIETGEVQSSPKSPGFFRFLSAEAEQDTGELNMGIAIRGATAKQLPKKPYSLKLTKDAYPSDTKSVRFMDMRKDEDWILDPSYRDTSFVRNIVAMDIARDVQPYAFLSSKGKEKGENSINGHLTEVIQNGQYQGIHVLEEKIDRKQLDLKKIKVPEDENGDHDWDQVDFNDPDNQSVLYKAVSNSASLRREGIDDIKSDFDQKYPNETNITHYRPLQSLIEFIKFSSDQEFIDGIGDIVDIDSIVDYWSIVHATQATDNFNKNYYIARSGAGKFKFFIWDLDASFGMVWDGGRDNQRDYWDQSENSLIQRLFQLPATGFTTKLKARWIELRSTALSKQSMYQHFVDYDAILQPVNTTDTPKNRNRQRWPGSGGQGSNDTELGSLSYINDFLDARLTWLDGQIANLP